MTPTTIPAGTRPVTTAAAHSRTRRLLTVGTPMALAALLLLHPMDPYSVGPWHPWYLVHYGALILTPLLCAAAYQMLDGLQSRPSQVARWALFPFMVFYPAWEALAGVGTGRLVELTNVMPVTQDIGRGLVLDWFDWAGTHWLALAGMAAWLAFAVGGAVAHHRAGSDRVVVVGLAGSALYPILHAGIPGAIPLLLMALAAWGMTSGRA